MQKEETVTTHCEHPDCVYRQLIDGGKTPICGYIIIEGRARGCSISECDKYKPGERIQPRMLEDYTIMWEYEIYEDANSVWQRLIKTDL